MSDEVCKNCGKQHASWLERGACNLLSEHYNDRLPRSSDRDALVTTIEKLTVKLGEVEDERDAALAQIEVMRSRDAQLVQRINEFQIERTELATLKATQGLTQDALTLAAKVSEDGGPMDLGLGPTIPRRPKDRRQQIALWFSEGKPRWSEKKQWSDGVDYYELTVSGAERYRHFGHGDERIGAVNYDKEYKGWDVAYGSSGEYLHDEDGDEAIFPTAEEAKEALMEAIPRLIEEGVKVMAEIAVEEIYEKNGFWFDQLFPVGSKEDAAEWLVDELWESGYFDTLLDAESAEQWLRRKLANDVADEPLQDALTAWRDFTQGKPDWVVDIDRDVDAKTAELAGRLLRAAAKQT